MELKNYSQGHYDGGSYVLKGVARNKFALLSRYQHHLFTQLLERQHPLFVLFQPIGVSTLVHFRSCFEMIRKLIELGLPAQLKDDSTPETPKGGFEGMYGLGSIIVKAWLKVGGALTSRLWIVMIGLVAAFGLLSYAWLYELVEESDKQYGFPFLVALLWLYVLVSTSLSWRTLVRAAFLHAAGRKADRPRFEFWGPFLCLGIDTRDIWLEGLRARVGLAFLGALAPLSLVGVLGFLNMFNPVTPIDGVIRCFPCLLTTLLLLCPLHAKSDGAELLQCALAPHSLEENLSKILRSPSFYLKNSKVLVFVGALAAWAFLWTDVWRSFLQLSLPAIVDQLYINYDPGTVILIKLGEQLLYLILAYPLLVVLQLLIRLTMRQKIDSLSAPLTNQQPLTFQEQNLALSKVPLFVSLSERESGELFLQLETRFYADGQAMVKQGEVGEEFFIVVRGRAVASYTDQMGVAHTVGRLQEGDAFGEVALIDSVPRTASVFSDGGCYAVILQKSKFQEFIAQTSSVEDVKQMIRLSSFLKKHPLFQRLEAKDLAEVIKNLHYESLAPREQLLPQVLAENFYLVYSGSVKVDSGDDATDFVLGPEDSFGFSPFSPEGVQGQVSAIQGAGVLRLPKDIFLDYVWDRFLNRPELLWSK